MQIAIINHRRTFITADDMVYAMAGDGVIGICQCNVEIGKRKIPAYISMLLSLITFRTRPDAVVVTQAKTYFFKEIFYNKKESIYSFRKIYKINNTDIERKETSTKGAVLLGLSSNYSAKLAPSLFKKSPLFTNNAINIEQVKEIFTENIST